MKSETLNYYSHPNSFKWPDEDVSTQLPIDSSICELQIQIAALNKRLDYLTHVVQEIVTPYQQENVLQLFR